MVQFNTRNYNKKGVQGKVRLRAEQFQALAAYFGSDPKGRKIEMPGNIEMLRTHSGWYTIRPMLICDKSAKRQTTNMVFAIRMSHKVLNTMETASA